MHRLVEDRLQGPGVFQALPVPGQVEAAIQRDPVVPFSIVSLAIDTDAASSAKGLNLVMLIS